MRVRLHGDLNSGRFAAQLLRIGNRNNPLDTEGEISFSLGCGVQVNTLDDQQSFFPNINQKFKNTEWLCEREILSLRIETVHAVN